MVLSGGVPGSRRVDRFMVESSRDVCVVESSDGAGSDVVSASEAGSRNARSVSSAEGRSSGSFASRRSINAASGPACFGGSSGSTAIA